jgi:hypothetical protein
LVGAMLLRTKAREREWRTKSEMMMMMRRRKKKKKVI